MATANTSPYISPLPPISPQVQSQAGSSGQNFNVSGNLVGAMYVSTTGISPGATGADNVIGVIAIPANLFDNAGRGIQITASGSFGANTDTKTVKAIYNPATAVVGSTVGTGGTTVATTGAVTTNGGGWQLQISIYKTGSGGSNTQIGIHQQAQVGSAVSALTAPSALTGTESGVILVAITANAATTASDVVLNFLEAFVTN